METVRFNLVGQHVGLSTPHRQCMRAIANILASYYVTCYSVNQSPLSGIFTDISIFFPFYVKLDVNLKSITDIIDIIDIIHIDILNY